MAAALMQFPDRDIRDIPRALRALADKVEGGEFGDAHNLAWVIDCGNGQIETGLAGDAPQAGITAHFLWAMAMRKIGMGCMP